MKLQVSATGIGSTTFVRRLVRKLKSQHGVTIDKNRPDVYFSSVWQGVVPKGAASVHRVDGVYFNSLLHNGAAMNKKIAKSVNKSDGVVYQSNYSHLMCRGILKTKKKGKIIYNGFDESVYDGIPVDKMGFSTMLVACASWRSLKRPRSIAKGFLAAGLPDAVLIMIGKINKKDRIKSHCIKYVGSISSEYTYKYYKSCDGLIHISRLDACPNVVVEALSAGKPVLCNNVGGTPELVKEDGVIINIDPPLDYKKFPLRKPDKVNSKVIAAGIHNMLSKNWSIDRPDLSMNECARKYYDYFNKVLNSV